MKVKIWNPDQQGEEDADEIEIGNPDVYRCFAAEDYAEKNFAHWDYPGEITLHIREGAELHIIAVEVCQKPVFNAAIKNTP